MSDKTKQQKPAIVQRSDRLLLLAEVAELTTLPPDAIEKLCRKNQFPQPLRFSRRYYRWREREVIEFLANAPRGLE